MKRDSIKKLGVTIITVGYILGSMAGSVFASDTTNMSTHKHYVSKTVSSTPSDTVKNEVVDGISFYITKINNASDQSSSYKKIRVYLTGSSDTIWTVDTGSQYAPAVLSNTGSTAKIVLTKNKYYEIFTASTRSNTVSIYYYGNDSTKAAYVYIREGVNAQVSTD